MRDRTPNVALVVGSVEEAASEFGDVADDIRVHFPWGSLLRGVLGDDEAVLAAIARLPKPGGSVTALLSIVPRDGVAAGRIDRVRLASRWIAHGLHVSKIRPLTRRDVDEAASSWGKRLSAGSQRPGLLVRGEKAT